jgi:membrane protein DedA with SNARE-associated domain
VFERKCGAAVLMLLAIAVGTFASEDVTCVATALLIQQGHIDPILGTLACALGIFAGDVGLWVVGRIVGHAALAWKQTDHTGLDLRDAAAWLERHAGGAILASRFLPGTRFVLYIAAGIVRVPFGRFAAWAFIGAVLWVPLIVLLTVRLGDAFAVPFGTSSTVWIPRMATGAFVLASLALAGWLSSPLARARFAARCARWSRWEFWPAWLFYAPVALWIGMLAAWHRSLTLMTAANPGIPDGGTVGESKSVILRQLPEDVTLPFVTIDRGTIAERMAAFEDQLTWRAWTFPIILKPDVGQRGVGVKLARRWQDVHAYFASAPEPIVAQAYHPGPFEAGVFYYRDPGARRGRILSITDKVFPVLVGDGVSTIEWLIWTHPRYRLQGATFVRRHADALHRVLQDGEQFALALAGNHAQGTLFRDGAHLATPELERRIDEIARAYPGFFVGRFDIRYSDVDAFKAGRDIAIVELNGVTAESTNIYDPNATLLDAYRVLFRQWAIVFAIGDANRRAGAAVSSPRRLVSLLRVHLTATVPVPVSD